MACLGSYPGLFRDDLEDELYSPRARLLRGDYPLMPSNRSRQLHSDRPLSYFIANGGAHDARCATPHRPHLESLTDRAGIDREGPYDYSACIPRCRTLPHFYNDADYVDPPDPHWRFSYTYPLQCMEPEGVPWGPDQIHAYNRDVLRHNSQIARRQAVRAPGEHMMLHPMMDQFGRFPPGFDRPLDPADFFSMDEPLVDSHRHHYGLPQPETLQRLLLLNAAEQQLRRRLKQIQLLELYGARRLAEQFAVQLLAAQNALPGLGAPRCLGHGLGPDFDDTYLSPLTTAYGGATPLNAIGYGNGLANWNFNMLPQLMAAAVPGGGSGHGGRGLGPWSGPGATAPWSSRPGLYPGTGMNRSQGFPGSWPGMPYGGDGWDGQMGGFGPRSMGTAGGPSNIRRVMEAISCDGGGGNRRGRFG